MVDPVSCRKILTEAHEKNGGERMGFCDTLTMAPTKAAGYIQLSYKGSNKFALLHEVIAWESGHRKTSSEQDYSHLCGNPKCCTLGHVVVESRLENQRRKGCVGVIPCPHQSECGRCSVSTPAKVYPAYWRHAYWSGVEWISSVKWSTSLLPHEYPIMWLNHARCGAAIEAAMDPLYTSYTKLYNSWTRMLVNNSSQLMDAGATRLRRQIR